MGAAVNDYVKVVGELACQMLELVAEGLGLPNKTIFSRMIKDPKSDSILRYIDKDDLLRFMIEEEVDFFFPFSEANKRGQISLRSFSAWVVKVFKERIQPQHALNDDKTAVKQLNKVVLAIRQW